MLQTLQSMKSDTDGTNGRNMKKLVLAVVKYGFYAIKICLAMNAASII